MLVRIFPLKYYHKILSSQPSNSLKSNDIRHFIGIITKSINRVSKIVPWNCNCLNKVLVAKTILNQYGIKSNVYLTLIDGLQGGKNTHASLLINNDFHYLNLHNLDKTIVVF